MRGLTVWVTVFVVLGVANAVRAEGVVRPLAPISFCRSALQAGQAEAKVSPLGSLRTVEYWLRQTFELKPGLNFEVNPYRSYAYLGDLRSKRRRLLSDPKALLARLEQLDADTTAAKLDGMFVAREFRGNKAVAAARSAIVSEANQINAQIQAELDRRFPSYSRAGVKRFLSIALPAAGVLLISHEGGALLDLMTSASVTLPVASILLGYKFFREEISGMNQLGSQIRQMDAVLAGKKNGAPISLVSGQMDVPTELHQALLANNGQPRPDEIEQMADVGTRNEREMENLYRMNAAYPEGRLRHVFYDSIFYVDPETMEPVWLLYYRAFKDKPQAPKRPYEKDSALAPAWAEPTLAPGLVPVPVRVDK